MADPLPTVSFTRRIDMVGGGVAVSEAASKVRPHGDMPTPLRDWALHGAGAAEIGWGAPDDYYRCLAVMGRHVDPKMLHGLCGNLHEEATGMSTAEHTKLLRSEGKDHPHTAADVHAAKAHGRL